MQPMAISASYFSVAASFFAASGNSNEPGTCTTSTSLLLAPARSSASTAAERSRSVIKLLNRLTTMPKRNPAALSPPSLLPGLSFSSILDLLRSFFPFPYFLYLIYFLPPFELRWSLLQKPSRAFAHVFRRARQSKKRRLEKKSFFLRHFYAALDRFHDVLHGQRPVGHDFLGHLFCRGNQFRWFVDVIHQAYSLCLFRRAHFAGQAQFLPLHLPAKPTQTLRSTVARQDAQ